MPKKTEAGHWLVYRGEAQWLAWRDWLKREFQYRFFPDKLPVVQEWPPETAQAAAAVADYYRDLNAKIEADEIAERKKSKGERSKPRSAFKPIPIAPMPWIRWSEFECRSRVAEFNRTENPDGPYKRTNADMDALLAKVGRAPMRPRLSLTASVAAGRPLTEIEAAELAVREKSLGQERLKLLLSKLPDQRGE